MADSYLRFPHLRDDLITFVAENDVWLAPRDGGRAWRMSADHVPASNPRLSPDGSLLAWTSTRDGDPEVHVADTDGGASRRLTYWGDGRTEVLGWLGADEVLVHSAVDRHALRGQTWAYAVPIDGGPARLLPYGPAGALDLRADGAVVLGSCFSREPAYWKRYRGGTTGKLWVDAAGSGEFTRILSEVDGHIVCPMWVGERIAFCDDHEGVGAVYSCAADGSDLRRHTHGEFYARHASTDGTRVIYESAGELWLLSTLDSEPEKLDVRLAGPRTSRQPYPVDAGHYLGDAMPDRTGRASVIEVRGTAHWLTHSEGPARVLHAEPGVRIRLPRVLGDTGSVAFVTDADGEDAIEVLPSIGRVPGAAPNRIGTGRLGRIQELIASPDGRYLAVIGHDRRLSLLTVDSGEIREVITATMFEPQQPAFSPDSQWLAWSHPTDELLANIKLANTTDLSVTDVTEPRFDDTDPVFTTDGKHLAFLSRRTFDPVYDTVVFDLSFPPSVRPYLVPLAALTPSPFHPSAQGRAVGGDSGKDGKDSKDSKDGGSDVDTPPRTEVDLDGLSERVTPFPVAADSYGELRAVRGGVLWLRSTPTGALGEALSTPDAQRPKPALERFDFDRRRCETVADDVYAVEVSGDGNRAVLQTEDGLQVLPVDRKPGPVDSKPDSSDEDTDIDLDRVRVTVHPAAEWAQSYDETGRLMRDHFWRADMNGLDWAEILRRYRPLVERVGSHDDLVDVLWEVHGELGTSHAYVIPRGNGVQAARRLGLLGADLERDAEGQWRVRRVLPSDTSRHDARSPLAAPGVAVRPGDAITAVNGRRVDPVTGPAPLLAGTAGQPVELTVAPAGGGAERTAVIIPLADDKPLRYQARVAEARRYVHEATDGRVGYLHVPDMQAAGWAELHRDLRREVAREALIVDVRENRGGHLSQLVVEKLRRRVVGWNYGRDGYIVETYPNDAPRGPIVALANEFSGSDGDIVTAAIKAYEIAPVIGTRTWGGTIGIDNRYYLVDGTKVTQPKYATWLRGQGWGMENHGVDPDIEVVQRPQDWVEGTERQLDEAIRLVLDRLRTEPAATMPDIPALG